MTVAEKPALEAGREAYWAEWAARAPQSPDEIAAFYREAEHLGADLDLWHQTPERQSATTATVGVAQQIGARSVVDVGCGRGYDLRALREAGIDDLCGVEPNDACRRALHADGFDVCPDVALAPLETADLVTCIDVLEHVPEPESFLDGIAKRLRLGAVLIETTATDDIATPMHLPANQGWHPGRCLERNGFVLLDRKGRYSVWQRAALEIGPRASILLCAYRTISIPTMTCLLNLAGVQGSMFDEANQVKLARMAESTWRVTTKYADGLISRARSIVVSRWWAETADDVFLMIDDDVTFSAADAERLVQLCRDGHDLICGAYVVGDCSHLAIRHVQGEAIDFAPGLPPVEIEYAATGFMAVSRRVIDALVPTLPLCHADQPWAFWPLFMPMCAPMQSPQGPTTAYLSEDWAFCHRAREAGFTVWVDPTIRIGHLKGFEIDVTNMRAFEAAAKIGRA